MYVSVTEAAQHYVMWMYTIQEVSWRITVMMLLLLLLKKKKKKLQWLVQCYDGGIQCSSVWCGKGQEKLIYAWEMLQLMTEKRRC